MVRGERERRGGKRAGWWGVGVGVVVCGVFVWDWVDFE